MPSAEQLRLDRLLRQQEVVVQEAFLEFLRNTRSDYVVREIADYLEAGDLSGAMAVIDSHIVRLGTVIADAFQAVGGAEAAHLAAALRSRYPAIGIAFDPTNPRAAGLMRNSTLQFVQALREQQRETLRVAMTGALERGLGPVAAARVFRDSIGLTTGQYAAVNNYRRLLENGSAEALARDLRDRRFDRTVSAAITNQTPLSSAQIDRMVERYRDRALMMRSETIARTEMLRTVNEARDESVRQVVEQVGLPKSRVVRIWRSTPDARTRDHHASMDLQERGMDEPFEDGLGNLLMYPGDMTAPAETVINCRCVVAVEIRSEAVE